MLLDWIKREPVKFAFFVQTLVGTVLLFVTTYTQLSPELAAGVLGVSAAFLAWLTAAVVVPTVKLPEATVARAADMTKADIARVEAVKKAGG